MNAKQALKKIWTFLKKDTWTSWFVSLILIALFIWLIFFPSLSFITASPLPLVVVESCSMYHESNFDTWWDKNSAWYESKSITRDQFENFPFKNGLNKGDIIFVWGRSDYNIGDIIIFQPNPEALAKHPLIHRKIQTNPIATKGDHNPRQLTINDPNKIDETNIPQENILGKSAAKIPALGWIKLIFFEPFRQPEDKGLCK